MFPWLGFCQLTEDFSDGDFTSNPVWNGDNSLWQVTGGQLNSNSANVNSAFYLSTPVVTASNTEWRIYMNLKFSTSGANYVDVYLASDSANCSGNGSGYLVRVGGTPDEISLYRKDAGAFIKLIDGTDGRSQASPSDNKIHLKIMRSLSDTWTLSDDITGTGLSFITEGTVIDATYPTGSYFGISVTQSTASFFNKHFFDDIYAGAIQLDTLPPSIVSVNAPSANQADVLFNEPVELISSQTSGNYSVNNGIGNPATSMLDGANPALVHLTFSGVFSNGILNTLTVSGVKDLSNNAILNSQDSFTYIAPVNALQKDVIINEILADPSPQVGLPAVEYLELFNNSVKTFNLAGWTISDGTTTGSLVGSVLAPGQFIIVCYIADTSLFSGLGITTGLSSFPSLNNTGDDLLLTDNNGTLIDEVIYSDHWFLDAQKKDGGWSLELINPGIPVTCTDSANWAESVNPSGGTPGQQNSVYSTTPDIAGPLYVSALATDSLHVFLCFNEGILTSQLANPANYFIDKNIGIPASAMAQTGDACVTLTLTSPLISGTTYTLSETNLTDCSGNPLMNPLITFTYYESEPADSGDLVINEILFNPKAYGYDYVEIYNRSQKVIDLTSLNLAGADVVNGTLYGQTILVPIKTLLLPGDYAVFTERVDDIKQRYQVNNSDKLFEVSNLPTWDDNEGIVVLINQAQQRIDQVYYSEEYQFPLLTDVEGVALERLSSRQLSNDPSNWHSAAQTTFNGSSTGGYGTPTYKNSENTSESSSGSTFNITPEIFSPDEDGFQDVLRIGYHFETPGLVANIQIYDGTGRLVRKLVRNELLGNDGSFNWDGIDENREKAPIGIYVIYIEVFDKSGDVKKYKRTCVLGGKI